MHPRVIPLFYVFEGVLLGDAGEAFFLAVGDEAHVFFELGFVASFEFDDVEGGVDFFVAVVLADTLRQYIQYLIVFLINHLTILLRSCSHPRKHLRFPRYLPHLEINDPQNIGYELVFRPSGQRLEACDSAFLLDGVGAI